VPSMRVGVLPKTTDSCWRSSARAGLGATGPSVRFFAESRRRRPESAHTTIYRALDVSARWIRSRGPRSGRRLLDVRTDGSAARAFLLHRLRLDRDVDYRLPEGVLGSLAERHHVAITGETLTFDGRCKTCLEAPATI